MTFITGHRGAKNLWPENSLTGFREAIKLGCDTIEFDVHLTHSGELLVIHDPTLDRTTEESGYVADLSPEARKVTNLKGCQDCIPTLDEVLEVLAPAGVGLHVEIKVGPSGLPYADLDSQVVKCLRAHDVAQRAYLTSFDLSVLKSCRAHSPDIARLVSADRAHVENSGGLDSFLSKMRGLADIVALQHDYFSDIFDQVTQGWPIEHLCAWTVNEPEIMKNWLDRGVGHLTTDAPDLALALRRSGRG